MADGTVEIQNILRSRLLAFTPMSGDTIPALTGTMTTGSGSDGKLWWTEAPDGVDQTTPAIWAILALKNRRPVPDIPEAYQAELEIMWFGRPRDVQDDVERAADVADEAFLRFRDVSGGLVAVFPAQRTTMPIFPSPADRDVVQIMQVFPLRLYPENQTQYADSV